MKELLTAIISAIASLLVVIVTYVLNSNRDNKIKAKLERDTVNLKYLNPLRFSLVENYFRLTDI